MKKMVCLFVALLLAAVAFAGCAQQPAAQDGTAENAGDGGGDKLQAAVCIRSLDNLYEVTESEGAEMFAAQHPDVQVTTLECKGSDETQLNQIKAFVASHGADNSILYVDPNNATICAEIAEFCEENGVYWSSVWSMAEGITPTNYEYYVSHQTPDDTKSGYLIAKEMFEAFDTPGEGKILAIGGMVANTAAINRANGLDQALAEYPGVELLDMQPGDFDATKALSITQTWLAKYDDIDGIWACDDAMALAAVEALKAKGLDGKVYVVGIDGVEEAVAAIEDGTLLATVSSNGWLQGGYGVAYPYHALKGDIDPSSMSQDERIFHTEGILITEDNLAEYKAEYVDSKPEYDFDDLAFPRFSPFTAEELGQ